MSKKEILIIILTIIVFALAGFGFFVFLKQNGLGRSSDTGEDIDSVSFPTGGNDTAPIGKGGGPGSGRFVDQDDDGNIVVKKGQIMQLTQDSVSGAVPVSSTTLRYIDRSTGNIFEVGYSGRDRKRLTNTTLLKSFETLWSPKADKALIRYFEDFGSGAVARTGVKNFLADLSGLGGSEAKELNGVFLPSDSKAFAASPLEDKIFYLAASDDGYQGVVANFQNEKKNSIFSLAFGDFNADWPSRDVITLVTKPSAVVGGYLYFLNQRTEKFERLLGGVKGLTAKASPDTSRVIYSESDSRNGNFNTKVLNVSDGSTVSFDFTTLPEKCVWAKDAKSVYCAVPSTLPRADYPDEWYKGEIAFNDSIWKKDYGSGSSSVLYENLEFDAINLALSASGEYLIFTDKATGILWSLKI